MEGNEKDQGKSLQIVEYQVRQTCDLKWHMVQFLRKVSGCTVPNNMVKEYA